MKANLIREQNLNLPDIRLNAPMPIRLSGDLGGSILTPGLYETDEPIIIQMGDLTLDAQGDEDAVWIFHLASFFTTVGGNGGSVVLSGGAKARNVFWQIERLALIGEGTTFKGNILTKYSNKPQEELSAVNTIGAGVVNPFNYPAPMYTRLKGNGISILTAQP